MAKTFCISLRAARITRGISLEAAAAFVGVKPATLARHEKDPSRMHLLTAQALCKLYQFSADHIHFGPESDLYQKDATNTAKGGVNVVEQFAGC